MGSYGVAAAALNYFDKSLDQLTLEEMAYLAALPKAPANYHPIRKTRAATIRRDWVLGEMQQNGFITGDEARRARAMPLQIARQSGFDSAEAPYFAEEVRREVVSRFGEDMLYAGGLSVRTTLDPELQHAARMALQCRPIGPDDDAYCIPVVDAACSLRAGEPGAAALPVL